MILNNFTFLNRRQIGGTFMGLQVTATGAREPTVQASTRKSPTTQNGQTALYPLSRLRKTKQYRRAMNNIPTKISIRIQKRRRINEPYIKRTIRAGDLDALSANVYRRRVFVTVFWNVPTAATNGTAVRDRQIRVD